MAMWGIVADDLTGAADTAVQFVRLGEAWVVRRLEVPSGIPGEATTWCVDTASRSLPVGEATAVVRMATARLRDLGCSHLYKKIDSTLRGHVGAELDALLEASGCTGAIVAPALPAQARVTIDGIQRVGARDIGYVPSVLRAHTKRPVIHMSLAVIRLGAVGCAEVFEQQLRGGTVLVADAETEEDLSAIAAAVRHLPELPVMCGAAGLARAIVQLDTRTVPPAAASAAEIEGPTWSIIGSPHPANQAQVAYLRRHGSAVVLALGFRELLDDEAKANLVNEIVHALQEGTDVVTYVLPGPTTSDAADRVPALLGALAPMVVDRARVGALILSGGETAEWTCEALGAWGLQMEAEVLPGIPQARLLGGRGDIRVFTKAGGFGAESTLFQLLAALRRPKEVMRSRGERTSSHRDHNG